jgi:hypothetical protein
MVMMFWSYRVANWADWSETLKEMNAVDPDARERRLKYGMIHRWVYRSVDDPNEVMMVAQFQTREGALALLQDPEGMRRWHERTGVEVFPPVLITEELEELHWTS